MKLTPEQQAEIEAQRRDLVSQDATDLLAYYRFDDGGVTAEDLTRKACNGLLHVPSPDYLFGDFSYGLATNGFSFVAATAAERLAAVVDDHTSAVLVSSVYYQTGHIVPELRGLLEACRGVGAELLIDAYHAINVVPVSLARDGLEDAYVVGGGYKYCQLGEGNCFLRFPRNCAMRPVITGWFSEFSALAEASSGDRVVYGGGSDAASLMARR